MRNTFNLAFYCRTSHMDKKGLAPIELSVSLNARRCIIALPMKMNPGAFEKQMAAKKNNELKAYVSSVDERIHDLQMKYATAGKVLTLEDIQVFVKSGFNTSYTLNELWEDFFQAFKKKGTTARNERKYELVMESFFSNVLDGTEQVANLNHAHVLAFERFLKSTFSNSTAANMLSKFRSIVLFGIHTDKMEADPFKGIKIVKKAKEVDFLTMNEVNRLRDKTMPNERLERVKDLFLFQCFTALSYCDMAALSPIDFQNNQYGQIMEGGMYSLIEDERLVEIRTKRPLVIEAYNKLGPEKVKAMKYHIGNIRNALTQMTNAKEDYKIVEMVSRALPMMQ